MSTQVTEVEGMSGILGTANEAALRRLLKIAKKWFEDPKVMEEYQRWKEEQGERSPHRA